LITGPCSALHLLRRLHHWLSFMISVDPFSVPLLLQYPWGDLSGIRIEWAFENLQEYEPVTSN
jgi:hypothetical protein